MSFDKNNQLLCRDKLFMIQFYDTKARIHQCQLKLTVG
jgi:hypothetical protein